MRVFYIIYRTFEILLTVAYLRLDKYLLGFRLLWPFFILANILPKYRKLPKSVSRGESLKYAAVYLGPIFIKLGQIISIRPDLFPEDIVVEMMELQDRVAPFNPSIAKDIIAKELKCNLQDVFVDFNDKPIASASIAQVHAARLHTQEEVVIKVVRPNIVKLLKKDLLTIKLIVKILYVFMPDSRRCRLNEVVALLEKTFTNEVNLEREAANAAELRRNFVNSSMLYIPKVYWQFTTKKILVMEKISGIPITEVENIQANNISLPLLASNGVKIFFEQVFRDGFFHADMHPGNIFANPQNPQHAQYIAVDFGIVGKLSASDQSYMADILLAYFNRDFYMVAKLHRRAGWLDDNIDLHEFADEIRVLSERIFEKPIKDISIGHLLMQLLMIGRKFNMHVQPSLILFQKTLFQIEGLGKQLYPELDFWVIAREFLQKWQQQNLLNIFNPIMQSKSFLYNIHRLPDLLHDAIQLPVVLQEKSKQKNYVSIAVIGSSSFLAGLLVAMLYFV